MRQRFVSFVAAKAKLATLALAKVGQIGLQISLAIVRIFATGSECDSGFSLPLPLKTMYSSCHNSCHRRDLYVFTCQKTPNQQTLPHSKIS